MKAYVVFIKDNKMIIQEADKEFDGVWVATYLDREPPILIVNPTYSRLDYREKIIDLINAIL